MKIPHMPMLSLRLRMRGSETLLQKLMLPDDDVGDREDDDASPPTLSRELDKNEDEDDSVVSTTLATQLLSQADIFSGLAGLNNLRNTPQAATPDTSFNSAMNGKRGRKRKFSPEERLALAQLYHDHFTIYHSKRYLGPDYVETSEASLKIFLLNDWGRQLTEMGIAERGTMDIGNRINEMIAEVADVRRSAGYSIKIAMHQMSPSFLLFSKVYNHISDTHEPVEKLLDEFERKTCRDQEDKVIASVDKRKTKPWTAEEKLALVNMYKASYLIYQELPVRKKDQAARSALLKMWCATLMSSGSRRTVDEVEALIGKYRRGQGLEEVAEEESPRKTRNTAKRRKREPSPTAKALAAIPGFLYEPVNPILNRTELFSRIKEYQDELLKNAPILTEGTEIIKVDVRDKTPEEAAPPVQQVPPMLQIQVTQPPKKDLTIRPIAYTGRSNRPHMSRHERHLLGLLYRQNHVAYETYNNPHVARRTPQNKKWQFLQEWCIKLTELGVSKRAADELATKISQYKNIIKTHYGVLDGNAVNFSSEYKLRRCLRPMSPTTKLYDTSEPIEEDPITDEYIEQYVNDALSARVYPSSIFAGSAMTMEASCAADRAFPNMKTPLRVMLKRLAAAGSDEAMRAALMEEFEREDMKYDKEGSTESDLYGGGDDMAQKIRLPVEYSTIEAEPLEEFHLQSQQPSTSSTRIQTSSYPKTHLGLAQLAQLVHTERDSASHSKMVALIKEDLKRMETDGTDCCVYDCVDHSGQMTRLAITKVDSERDVNYFIWSRNLDLHGDRPVTMFNCHMCDLMAAASILPARRIGAPTPANNILAQALPFILVDDLQSTQFTQNWVKLAPRHRCVPFLASTMCEKMADICHSITRYVPPQLKTDEDEGIGGGSPSATEVKKPAWRP